MSPPRGFGSDPNSSHRAVSPVGVRILGGLDGEVTDIAEAQALSFKPQHVDVYLASWGPEDDGATVDGPGPLTRLALENGIRTVRLYHIS